MRAMPSSATVVLTLLAATFPTGSARADHDYKAVSPALCQPYAPDTTAADVQVTQNGIYNPGTAIEKVICALPRDVESAYPAGGMVVGVYYRVLGGAPGRLTCTLFLGSTGMLPFDPVQTSTVSGNTASGGERDSLWIGINAQASTPNIIPNTMICAISPKTLLAGIHFEETVPTDYVDPPA